MVLGQVERLAGGHPAVHPLLRRNHRAVAAAAEIVADLAQGGAGVLAGQPHRQHPRMAHPLPLRVGLQAGRLQPKGLADGLLDVRQPHRPNAVPNQIGQGLLGHRQGNRPAQRLGRGLQAAERPESSRAWLVRREATNRCTSGGTSIFIRRAIWPRMPKRVAWSAGSMRQTRPLVNRVVNSGPNSASSAGERSAAKTSCRPSRRKVSTVCSNSICVARLPTKNCRSSRISNPTPRYLRRKLGKPLPRKASRKWLVNCSAER